MISQRAVVEQYCRHYERAGDGVAIPLVGAGDEASAETPIEPQEPLAGSLLHDRDHSAWSGCGRRGGRRLPGSCYSAGAGSGSGSAAGASSAVGSSSASSGSASASTTSASDWGPSASSGT